MTAPAIERARTLASLFREAQSAAIHPAGCLCGGMFRPVLDAAGLEADLLDYLAPRYAEAGRASLAGLVQTRLDAPGAVRFAEWLRALAEADLVEADRTQLFDDLQGLLDQMVQAARPAGRFVCT
jgi:hypothetical protein